MLTTEELKEQVSHAIQVSESIVDCLNHGDFEAAKKFDSERAEFIRTLSRCRNITEMMPEVNDSLEQLKNLNTMILKISHQLREDVMTQLHSEHTNRRSHEQYIKTCHL